MGKAKFWILGLNLIFLSALAACGGGGNEVEKIIYVGPELVECEGAGPQQCMLVKENPEDEYQLFYDRIEGFNYLPGYEYKLKIREEQVENPPADASSIRWVLVDVLEKNTPQSTEAEMTLEGILWVLQGYVNAQGNLLNPLPGTQLFIRFEDGAVSGSAGCNSFNGTYELSGRFITFGPLATTMMACEEAVMDQEATFLTNLQNAATYSVNLERLLFVDEAGATLLNFEIGSTETILDQTWVAGFIGDGDGGLTPVIPGTEITAVFASDGTLTGSAGCNQYNTTYEASVDSISITGPIATTRKLCSEPESIMDQESAYLLALESAATWEVFRNQFNLSDTEGNVVLQFKPAPGGGETSQLDSVQSNGGLGEAEEST